MNVFSVNQVNQVYVVNTIKDSYAGLNSGAAGGLYVGSTPDKKAIYFQHKGPGGVTRSDLIDVNNIMDIKVTPAAKMKKILKQATVTLASGALVSNKPIPGQDYILRLTFDNYLGISPEDSKYWKYGMVHVTANMTASDFYKKLAISLAKNMSREAVELVGIYVGGTKVTHLTKETDLTGTYTSIVLKEVEPDWILGTKQQKVITFKANPLTVVAPVGDTKEEVTWGDVVYAQGGVINNGKLMADYEYFFHGERGDQYRLAGWPNYVPTTYLVDPTAEYDTYAIHFAYVGDNESVQKSEKDVTLLCKRYSTDTDTLGTVATGIQTAVDAIINPTTESEEEEKTP